MNLQKAKKLIELRKEKKLTQQEDLAFAIGTSSQVISKWERGIF